ncbi:hypothetical protein ACFL1S_03755 [Pseudomonadota bacterium]
MSRTAAQVAADENTTGLFNYPGGTVRASLYRSGDVRRYPACPAIHSS